VIRKIIQLCRDPGGFLVQLQVGSTFNQELYQELVHSFSRYQELLGEDDAINRRVARFIFDVVTVLEGEAYQFSLRKHVDADKVQSAHAEMLEILYGLLP